MNLRVRLQMIRDDCKTDAAALDGQPFTGRAIGTTFGDVLAMIDALAASMLELAQEMDASSA